MAEKNGKLVERQQAFALDGFVVSDVGLKRSNNEDNYLIGAKWNEKSLDRCQEEYQEQKAECWSYIAVFDGMGGGEEGEWASLVAAQELNKVLTNLPIDKVSPQQVDQYVRSGFTSANRMIVEESKRSAIFGTTGTVLVTDGLKFRIYHLGDSRAYLMRGEELQQLTEDQTLATMKIRLGFYKSDNPQVQMDKHKLTEYIGCAQRMDEVLNPVESEWYSWKEGDKILLCSDGLYDMCTDEMIEFVMAQDNPPRKIANQLLTYALRNGGADNVTCLVAALEKKKAEVKTSFSTFRFDEKGMERSPVVDIKAWSDL